MVSKWIITAIYPIYIYPGIPTTQTMGVNITTIAYLRVKKSSELGKNHYFNGGFSAQGVGYNLLILTIDPSTSVPRTFQVD